MQSSLIAPDGAPLPARPATITAHTHLRASRVTKSFGEGAVLADISVTARAGDCLAIIGDNGVGKSTLLRVLAGALPADEGEVTCTTTRSLVDQELVAPPGTTVGDLLEAALAPSREAIAVLERATSQDVRDGDEVEAALAQVDAIDAWNAERRLTADLLQSGVAQPAETLLEALSPGQRYRLRLACAMHVPGGAVFLDEPSNHLDDVSLDRLARRIADHDGIVILVSHDRWLLGRVATSFLDLDPGSEDGPRAFRGTFAELRAERSRARARWRDAYDANLVETERLEDELARARSATPDAWRPEKGTGRHQRASRAGGGVRMLNRRLDEVRDARPPVPPEPLRFELPRLEAAADTLITATDLELRGRVRQPAGEPLGLGQGGRLLMTGANGAGKSSLLALLAGATTPDAGAVVRDEAARIGWLRQEPVLPPRASALDHLAPLDDEDVLRERLLRTGLLTERDLDRPLGVLSVGQRQRVAIAEVLLRRPSVLLLDEPTTHLSVTLVDELGEALLTTPAAVVLVTHDRALREATAAWPQLELEPAAP
ncbi:MAG: ATP-binding cassette domain-containing protein [Solirubrobacteraceae bacterium]